MKFPDPKTLTVALLLDCALCLFVAILWSLPTLLNHFPLTYYDSGFYLHYFFQPLDPAKVMWRPYTYSYFMLFPAKLFGLTGYIIFQNLVVSGFLLKFYRLLFQGPRLKFFIITLLMALTPLPFTANFLMPDVFSALSVLAFIGVILSKGKTRLFYGATTLLFSLMHFGNIIMLACVTLFYFAKNRRKKALAAFLLVPVLITLRLLFSPPDSKIEQSAHYFLHSRLVAFQITNDYFDKVCPQADLKFCSDRDAVFSIWESQRKSHSPSKESLPDIVATNQGILKSPLLFRYVFESLHQSIRQALHFSRPLAIVHQDKVILNQLQFQSGIDALKYQSQRIFNDRKFVIDNLMSLLELIFYLTSCLSLLFLGWCCYKNKVHSPLVLATQYFVLAYLANALAVGFLSEPSGHYGAKLIWVIGFFTFSCLLGQFPLSKGSSHNEP